MNGDPVVRTWHLCPVGWPPAQRLRIAVVADLHAGPPQMPLARVGRVMAKVSSLGADLILHLGDYRASLLYRRNPIPIEAVAPHLASVSAPLGVFAVLGNHDWWDDPAAQARKAGPVHARAVIEAAGIPVLVNAARRIGAASGGFWLAGLDSQHAIMRHPRRHEGRDDLHATLAQVEDDAPVILMAHEPDIFAAVPPRPVALTLSGHTHGGQIRFGRFVPVVPSRFGRRYALGHVREGGRDLVVSGGLGCSGLPLRIGVPPEITVVELGQQRT